MNHFDPLADGLSSLRLERVAGSDLDIVNAARVSYGKESEEFNVRDEKLIRYLLANRHTSPFEHTYLVYNVKLPLYIARQWMRHRVGVSYNEVSGRYSKVPLEFYIPQKWRVGDTVNKQGSIFADIADGERYMEEYKKSLDFCSKTYQNLLEAGVAKELARGVLPMCTYTKFVFTCNLVSLFHFVKLRYDHHAQWEIQQYAQGMLELAQKHFPVSIATWAELNGYAVGETIIPAKKEQQLTV